MNTSCLNRSPIDLMIERVCRLSPVVIYIYLANKGRKTHPIAPAMAPAPNDRPSASLIHIPHLIPIDKAGNSLFLSFHRSRRSETFPNLGRTYWKDTSGPSQFQRVYLIPSGSDSTYRRFQSLPGSTLPSRASILLLFSSPF